MCYYFISMLQAFYNEKVLVVLIKIAKAKSNFIELGQACWHTSGRQHRCESSSDCRGWNKLGPVPGHLKTFWASVLRIQGFLERAT